MVDAVRGYATLLILTRPVQLQGWPVRYIGVVSADCKVLRASFVWCCR
jgi:hypothetical protein